MPKYRDIADDLKVRISSGEFGVGDRIPSLRQLMGSYGAAQHTVSRALKILREEKILRVSQGLPTVVAKLPDMGRATVLERLRRIRSEIDELIEMLEERAD